MSYNAHSGHGYGNQHRHSSTRKFNSQKSRKKKSILTINSERVIFKDLPSSDEISFKSWEEWGSPGFVHQSEDGSLTVKVMRAGRENTDAERGGTWYENKVYVDQKSSYQEGTLAPVPTGVGGKQLHEKNVELKQPYYIAWAEGTEGQIVVDAGERILGKERVSQLRKGITGSKAEVAYAKIEKEISQVLSSRGYDGIVFYSTLGAARPLETFIFAKS